MSTRYSDTRWRLQTLLYLRWPSREIQIEWNGVRGSMDSVEIAVLPGVRREPAQAGAPEGAEGGYTKGGNQ